MDGTTHITNRDRDGNLYVRYLNWDDDRWYSNWNWLDYDWNANNPALVPATCFISPPMLRRRSFVFYFWWCYTRRMSQYYKGRRTRNIFDPESDKPFKLSRSKIDLFFECPRCFYLDRKLGVGRPPGFPFSLNSAVDHLLKKEFDFHRAKQTEHPLMQQYKIDAVPFQHPEMNKWRDSLRAGVEYFHEPTNLLLTGGVDDIWQDRAGELIVVDYKATSKDGEVNLDAEWQDGYKRQMEFYQYLLRRNKFKVSNTGYFVYVNGKRDAAAFDARLEFDIKLIPYIGNDSWVEGTVRKAKECLMSDRLPEAGPDCDYCLYRDEAASVII